MNKIFFLFAAFVLIPFWFINAQPSDTTGINKIDASGRKQGPWKKYQKDTLKYTGQFKDNYPVGLFEYYYPNKKVKAKTSYSNKGTVARTVMYGVSGNKSAEGIYRNEKKDSIWKYYDENGGIVSEESYNNGLKNGAAKTFYTDGTVSEVVNWKNGAKNGEWLQYYTNGAVRLTGTYKNDKLTGIVKLYYITGKVKTYGEYINSLKQGNWMFMSEEGKPLKKEVYDQGVLLKTEYYDKALEAADKKMEEDLKK